MEGGGIEGYRGVWGRGGGDVGEISVGDVRENMGDIGEMRRRGSRVRRLEGGEKD